MCVCACVCVCVCVCVFKVCCKVYCLYASNDTFDANVSQIKCGKVD